MPEAPASAQPAAGSGRAEGAALPGERRPATPGSVPEHPDDVALQLLGQPYGSLDERAKKVARHIADRRHIVRNPAHDGETLSTRGQRAADAVASFGGSWPFVGIFVAIVVVWVSVNSVLLATHGTTFDPYPYVLLNLFLSMLAAIQAPVILMAQNRQADKDRMAAEHDYEVNLKSELEIMLLHEKFDLLREKQWSELIELQQQQLALLSALIDTKIGTE